MAVQGTPSAARSMSLATGSPKPARFEREPRAAVTCGDLACGFWSLARALPELRVGPPGRVLVQGARVLPVLLRQAHGRGRRGAHEQRGPVRAGTAVGTVARLGAAVPADRGPGTLRAVASAFLGAVFAHHVRLARALGHGVGPECDADPGAVTCVTTTSLSLTSRSLSSAGHRLDSSSLKHRVRTLSTRRRSWIGSASCGTSRSTPEQGSSAPINGRHDWRNGGSRYCRGLVPAWPSSSRRCPRSTRWHSGA